MEISGFPYNHNVGQVEESLRAKNELDPFSGLDRKSTCDRRGHRAKANTALAQRRARKNVKIAVQIIGTVDSQVDTVWTKDVGLTHDVRAVI